MPKFVPGISGNPRGRPTRKSVRELLGEKALGDIVDAMATAAKAGDVHAARLLIPPLKPEIPRVKVPGMVEAQSHSERAAAIATAAARGEISPDAAVALSAVVGNVARVVELDDLVRQVGELAETVRALQAGGPRP